jgi:hypothetical protein
MQAAAQAAVPLLARIVSAGRRARRGLGPSNRAVGQAPLLALLCTQLPAMAKVAGYEMQRAVSLLSLK